MIVLCSAHFTTLLLHICTLVFFFQIYVEVPRARLTMELAKIKESRGEIAEAANILQELQVMDHFIRQSKL